MPGKSAPAENSDASRRDIEQQATERTPLRYRKGDSLQKIDAVPQDKEVSLVSTPVLWVEQLSSSYSWKLLAMVFLANHMMKGFIAGGGDEGIVGKPIEFLFADMGISGGRIQMYKAAAIAPWALKPIVGMLSDACPIFGYKKMPYLILTSVLSVIAVACIGFGFATSLSSVVACLFLIFLQISSVDLLLQAKQSEEVKKKAHLGPQLFTFTWLGINVGQIAAVCAVGPMIHHLGPRYPYLLALPICALMLWPICANFLGESPLPPDERGVNFSVVSKHPVLWSLTLMIASIIAFLIFGTFYFGEYALLVISCSAAGLVLLGFLIFVRWEITGPILFYFMLGTMSFSLDGALFYFYTDTPEEYPEGPNYSAYFYTTVIGLVTFISIMAGFVSGAEIFKTWNYRSILLLTIVLRGLTQLALLPVLLRWTTHYNIPDTPAILLVTMMDTVVFAWRWIPKQVMGAHLAPKGVEATMLALTAGTFNMSMILSSYMGAGILHHYGVVPSGKPGESAMFSQLWRVQAMAAVAPLLLLPLLPVFIPSKSQTEPLLTECPDSATYGSYWERWRGVREWERPQS